jgi:hypothetical protein
MQTLRGERAAGVAFVVFAGALIQFSNTSDTGNDVSCSSIAPDASFDQSAGVCYPDSDGINGGSYTIDLDVNDTGFFATGEDAGAKNIIATQNDAEVTLTLTNTGTVPHGFEVECTNVCSVYPTLPAGCSPLACFPSDSTIAPIAPGASATVTFATPTPDGLIYAFKSSAPGDGAVPGLNAGQWSLM